VKVEDFVPAKAAIYQTILERFRENRIEIAAPRRDVHLLNTLT
jgi:small conductance mechanosensitive channel